MTYSDAYDPLEGIAIIGMAGRFPESPSVEALWQNLLARRECITRFAPAELEPAGREDMLARSSPNYVPARGVLAGADEFDEQFFGFTPKEAEIVDPQQRLFMQAAWEAIEHAGYDAQHFGGPIGVFAGAQTNSYYLQNLLSRSDVTDPLGRMTILIGNENDYLATRVSYKFDLTGPALNIQNACSTSLVAVCIAVQSLQTYQCDMALAGGVSIQLPQRRGYLHEEGSILAPDGHCRAFDRDAAGTVFSNGLGIVVLRRLRDAIEDGDTIYAVIKGAALNNDGSAKVGFTAPSVDGHARVISMAQMLGGIDPATISYIEAHGTGTALGDPIEIAGLTQAFRAGGADENGFCAIGSIKSNIGHLDIAAGVTGLIKTTLALHHRILPASINFESPNPKLGIESTPFFVNAAQRDWPEEPTPRRAGVSSFGVGGTNAHVVLEEAPLAEPAASASRPEQLLLLSACDAEGLDRVAQNLKDHLAQDASAELADIAYTLQVGRRRFNHRRSIVCRNRDDAIALLTNADPKRVHDFTDDDADPPRVAFMFPGQGSQYVDMSRRLYESEPLFRKAIEHCARVLQPEIGVDLLGVIYPSESDRDSAQAKLTQTAITQPALFAIEYALAQLWMSWAVKPDAMIGHSIGEFVAACIGGTFSLDDALLLVARRARLMDSMQAGAMLGVRASADLVTAELTPEVSIAAINAPKHTVVSGSHDAIAAFETRLDAKGVAHRRLHTSHAYHSPMMEPAVEPFANIVAEIPRRAPELRWISSLTGRPITDDEAVDPRYWARQLREPVQFARGVGVLVDAHLALIEVGPGQTLAALSRQHDRRLPQQLITTSLHPGQDWSADIDYLLAAAGQLWARNVDIDWRTFHGDARRRRVPLPTYPFRRTRHWVDPIPQNDAVPAAVQPVLAATHPAATAPTSLPTQDTTVITSNRSAALLSRLQTVFADLSGVDPAILTPDATFLEIGFDSLFLTQAANALQKQFATEITLRTLLEDAPTFNLLVERILPTLPEDALPATTPVAAATPAAAFAMPTAMPVDAGSLAGVAQQLAIISRQLEMLGVRPDATTPTPAPAPAPAAATPAPIKHSTSATEPAPPTAFGPFGPPKRSPTGGLTDQQEQHLAVPDPSHGGRMYLPANRDACIAFLREAQQLTAQQRAIVPLEAAGTRTPIFAVAGHNGDVFAYRALALHLGPDQPFFGLQPPGLEEGSEPLTRVEDMARYFAEQIRAFRPVGPMSIAGFCAGGTIAFELARQLTDSGACITNLILFGAPHYPSYRRPLKWKMAQARSCFVTHAHALRTMPAAERARYIAERARNIAERARRPLPREEVSDPVLIRRGAVEEATMTAVRAYSPEPSSSHVDFMIPCESSKRSWAHPLRWSRLAASSTVFVGPDDCNSDTMLLPEHAATFAAFVADAQQRHARGGAA
jgi:acyl transferase domain-containing protein